MKNQTYRISSFCEVKSGKRLPLGCDFSTVPTEYKYIRARDIKNGKIDISDCAYIDDFVKAKIKKYIIEKNDIAITVVANIGDVGICDADADGANLTENAVRLTNFNSRIVFPKYLAYYLAQPFMKQYMEGLAIGAAQAKLGIYKVNNISVELPSVEEQEKIANIINKYDKLIENNNKRIKILEQMAENLYKEWFVRFRFPGHETTPLENGIPKGWKLRPLFDVASVTYGFPFKSELFNNEESLNAVVRIRDILDNKTDTYTSESCDNRYLIKENAILIGMDGLFHMCLWNGSRAFLNQRVVMLNSKDDNICNYLLYLSVKPQIKFWEQAISGTTVAHLGDKHLKKVTVLIPNQPILKEANERFRAYMEQKRKLFIMNQNLIKQRDLLLPRLMSGKLAV